MTTRIYIVTNGAADPRLVNAPNQAAVNRHLVKPFKVEVASQHELVKAIGKGAKVEEVTAEDEQE